MSSTPSHAAGCMHILLSWHLYVRRLRGLFGIPTVWTGDVHLSVTDVHRPRRSYAIRALCATHFTTIGRSVLLRNRRKFCSAPWHVRGGRSYTTIVLGANNPQWAFSAHRLREHMQPFVSNAVFVNDTVFELTVTIFRTCDRSKLASERAPTRSCTVVTHVFASSWRSTFFTETTSLATFLHGRRFSRMRATLVTADVVRN